MGRALLVMEEIMISKYRFRETDKEGARKWVLECIHHDGFVETKRGDVANQVIKEALEKQMPKKPIIKKYEPTCPTCGGSLIVDCRCWRNTCGQAIDWSETEE